MSFLSHRVPANETPENLEHFKTQLHKVRHCGLVVLAPAWDGTGCEFDSWQCRIYIPCSLSLWLLGFLRGSWVHMAWNKNCVEKIKSMTRLTWGVTGDSNWATCFNDGEPYKPHPPTFDLITNQCVRFKSIQLPVPLINSTQTQKNMGREILLAALQHHPTRAPPNIKWDRSSNKIK